MIDLYRMETSILASSSADESTSRLPLLFDGDISIEYVDGLDFITSLHYDGTNAINIHVIYHVS